MSSPEDGPSVSGPREVPRARAAVRHGSVSVTSIILGLLAAICCGAHVHVAAGIFGCAFLLIGVGSIPLVLFARATSAQLDLGVAGLALAFALPVAGGFGMVELRLWVPYVLAGIVVILACGIHIAHLRAVAVHGFRRGLRADLDAVKTLITRPTGVSVLGLTICLTSGLLQYPLVPGRLGTLSTLSWVWYIGFVLCAFAAADQLRLLRRREAGAGAAAVPCIILVTVISLTTATIYPEPRFEWVGHHLGPLEYILRFHRANVGGDLYQAFPGLFAGSAWLIHVAHIGDPLTLARWFPAAIDAVTSLGVVLLARRLFRSVEVGWTAGVLFGLSLAFGQDYFSPQAISLAWAIVMFSLAVGASPLPRRFEISVISILGACIAVTHQLSPYPVFAALAILTLFRLARPWWLSLTALVPAVIWAGSHYSVWAHYLSSGFFDITANTSLYQFAGASYGQAAIVHIASYTLGLGLLVVGLFAMMDVVRHRDRLRLAILLCAVSPLFLLAATNYGGEADNRVVFFAMPWVAALAADWWQTTRVRAWMVGVVPMILSATSYVAITGMDWAFIESPSSVAAERFAEQHAGPNVPIVVAGDPDGVPVNDDLPLSIDRGARPRPGGKDSGGTATLRKRGAGRPLAEAD